MTMQFTRNLHAEGWWDHMPPGHRVDIVMNPGELPPSRYEIAPGSALLASPQPTTVFMSEPIVRTGPTVRTPPRRIKRSHASAWILVAAVGATGGALAVATMRDPQSLTSSSSTNTTTTQATATIATPAPTSVQETGPVKASESTVPGQIRSSDAAQPRVASAAGQSMSSPVPVSTIKHLATLAPSMNEDLADTQQVVPSLLPPTPLAPIQPPAVVQDQPIVQAPPVVVAPLTVQPPDEVASPPVQAPASSAQR